MRRVYPSFLLLLLPCAAQAQTEARICVQDAKGRAIAGARLSLESAGRDAVLTGVDGCAQVMSARSSPINALLQVRRIGFAPLTVPVPSQGTEQRVTLTPAPLQESVTVTADRGLPGITDQASSTAVVGPQQLQNAPGLALDDRLHQVAGFQLFRRTSSWTANPTTEGVSLRGLGSTAASRTLVESDEVPLNDPFGGWIHWDEIPSLAIHDVALVRGGAADLYGSSAVGGVIEVDPVTATGEGIRVSADALSATENSAQGDLMVTAGGHHGSVLLAGSGVSTGGYVPTAPQLRGTVDIPSNVAEESGRVELRTPAVASGNTAFLRGNVLNEARSNGTPDQTNGTRLWRYVVGGDLNRGQSHGALRLFGDHETYRQSFSSVASNRNSETLTRLQAVPVNEFGFSLTGAHAFASSWTGGLGLDLRDIRATDVESPVSRGAVVSTTAISAHQRELGGYAETIWQPKQWSIAGSVRVDSFRTFDGRQVSTTTSGPVAEPAISELVASPHLGVVRQLPGGLALTASAFRAFRGPTMNELYRTGQVGQQTTLANPRLLAERATGFEFGGELGHLRWGGVDRGRLRASYFWTEVNRPVSAVVLTQTASAQTLQRQNLGQIRSRGLSLESNTANWRGLDAGVGYQFAVATVTRFDAASAVQANLLGKWIPEVPRHMTVATVNWLRPEWANLHAIVSYTGRTYDDAANQFLLHPYARFDLSADRTVWKGISLYAGSQNLLNRSIDAGRTPLLTLAAPRLVQAGLRWDLSR